jgi:predicted RNA-binding protein with PUA domain
MGRYKGLNTVIADTRFPNEVKEIRKQGGKIIRVKRGTDPEWFVNYVEGNIEPKGIHSSEYAWAKEEFDYVIENNGDKASLYAKIDNLIVSNKITHSPAETSDPLQPLAIGANSF